MTSSISSGAPVGANAETSINLSDYSTTGSIAARIALFGAETAQDHKKSQKEGWNKSLEIAQAEKENLEKQADQVRDAAVSRFAGAIVGGTFGIAAGVGQIKSLNSAQAKFNRESAAGDPTDSNHMQKITTEFNLETQKAGAISQVVNQVGQMGKSAADLDAGLHDAQKVELDAQRKIISAQGSIVNQQTQVHGEEASKLLDIAGQAANNIQPIKLA